MRKALTILAALTFSSAAQATEPWVDPDPPHPPERYEIGAVGVRANAEYRAQYTLVNPISLTTEGNRKATWIEHRGRFGATVDYEEKISITSSFDVLDSVAWGDNGSFTGVPASDSGLNVTAREPNVVKNCILYQGEGDPLQADSYGYGLCEAEPIRVRRLWGQVNTPIGILRIGRQPVSVGQSIQTSSGDGRQNRFGVSYGGDSVDRILFATKPLEALKPEALRDKTETEGLIVAAMYDRWASDSPIIFRDDINQIAYAFRYLQSDFVVGQDLEAQIFHAHRWDAQYSTRINTVGGRLAARFDDFHFGIDIAANIGNTREISAAYSLITSDPVVEQEILQMGLRAVARYDRPMFTAYLEFDYASGDPDPSPRETLPDGTSKGGRLSQFRFSQDTNVGLLMFDHVLHFQSARAAAAGVEILKRLGSETFAAERINTRGSFTNAAAIFPQFDIIPHEDILFRGGVLVAWAPEPNNDPAGSLQAKDGTSIEDDLINFVGGKPGTFYGVELDGRFRWTFMDHFAFNLEGAVLFPGDALQDKNGQAVRSFLGQARGTFYF